MGCQELIRFKHFVIDTISIKIINISNSLRAGIAAGYDNIPIGIVKETIDLIMVSDPFATLSVFLLAQVLRV